MAKFISLALIALVGAGLFFWVRYQKESFSQAPQPLSHSSSLDLDEWQEYTDPLNQFTVFFPGIAHHATENKTEPKNQEKRNYQVYVAKKDNGSEFTITLISFPEKAAKDLSDDFLQSYINDELTANEKNTVKEIKLVNWSKGNAVDFNLENGGAVVLGKGFIDGNTLYIFTVATTQPENLDPQEFNFFINSFQLTKPSTPQQNPR